MAFGINTSSAPTFGSTGFGFGAQNTATGTGSTGFGFGGLGTTTTASTGFSFGAPTTTVAPFSFTATTSAPSFGFGSGFGATTTASSFGFGTTTTSAPSFGFGGGFGTTTSAPSFGFGGGFGTTTTSAPSFGFGANTATTSSFGQPLGGGGFLSSNLNVQPAGSAIGQQPNDMVTNLIQALTYPSLFGDERDAIIAKLNQLQASWGTGKGYYHPNASAIDFTPENPFCCFKAVGYSCLPSAKAEDCHVGIIFNKKEPEIQSQKQQLTEILHRGFGSKPNLTVVIDSIKALTEDRTEVIFYIKCVEPNGVTKRSNPAEICSYMEQPSIKPQLTNVGILSVAPKTAPTKEQLQQYLDNSPAGIEPVVWRQAKRDNPDPDKLIPMPLVSFQELSRRTKCQEYETKQHQKRLDIISDDIAELGRNHTSMVSKIAEHKRKLLDLQHRVLKVLVRQEVLRKMGYSIQADEEQLRIKLEAIQAELSAPTQFKGHLKELTSQIRMQNNSINFEGDRYNITDAEKSEIREHLMMYQEGFSVLINVIKEDMVDLNLLEEIVNEESSR